MIVSTKETTLHFDLQGRINEQGRNSAVYLAFDKQLGSIIVIKQMLRSSFTDAAEYFKEATQLYSCAHRNVVDVKYSCSDQDFIYIAMPYYQKGTLNKLINERFLTIREIVKYSLEFLSGLNYIHTRGLIHFDVKPTNILLSDYNEALISDFGLSEFRNYDGIAEQDRVYQPHGAPERYASSGLNNQFDIYQVGVTLYRISNGNKEYYRQKDRINKTASPMNLMPLRDAILSEKFPDRNLFLPHIPQRLRNIIKKCLQKDLNRRYQNVIELQNDIAKLDSNLDWQFSSKDENSGVYILNLDDKSIEVSYSKSSTGYSLNTHKIVKANNHKSNISEYCSSNVTISHIEECLVNLSNKYANI